eukprot:Nitzschia sp. Nitz4//scaffold6_size259037//144002//144879//NITZ4_001084-RA/size259037-augustus-gene-0.295-mRNA-1//1//CDS//3329556923//1315//frame0
MAPKGPKLNLIDATETTISVDFKPISGVTSYELEWRSMEQPSWNAPGQNSSSQVSASGSTGKAEAHSLEPGSTYCLRLICVEGSSRGEPGPELIIDTEQVGCTPQQKSGCGCVIQ